MKKGLLGIAMLCACAGVTGAQDPPANPKIWQRQAVWYQIFPERFRDGDPSNNPTRDSLPGKQWIPESWTPRAWTSDWYARDAWEQAKAPDFYWTVGERRYGGDIQGIIDKLGYLKDLGINAIYLNPIFYSASSHKYDAYSYHHVDPYFGPDPAGDLKLIAKETEDPSTWVWTAADKLALQMIKKAHELGIRVIFDGVFNHVGIGFFAFEDLRKNQQRSRYKDWFIVEKWDDPSTPENEFTWAGWHGIKSMPEFAEVWKDGTGDLVPPVKAHLNAITRRWMAPNGNVANGVDGWRLDVAWMVPEGFWRQWNALVHSINPSAITVTEIWKDAHKTTLGGHFDSTMNYEGFAMPVKGWMFDTALKPSAFVEWLDRTRKTWPWDTSLVLQNLLDSHDTPRAASAAMDGRPGKNYSKPQEFDLAVDAGVSPKRNKDYRWQKPDDRAWKVLRMAVTLQMTYVGAPLIYYGSEAGMWGANDPDCRKPMVWDDMNYDPEFMSPDGRRVGPHEVKFDRNLHAFYKAAITMRRSIPALWDGSIDWLVKDDGANTLAFMRKRDASRVLAVFNRNDSPQTVKIAVPDGWPMDSVKARFVSDGSTVMARNENGALVVSLPPLTAAVFDPPMVLQVAEPTSEE